MINTAIYTDQIASGASTSSGILFQGAYSRMQVQIPTMSTSTNMNIQHSVDGGTTWYNIFHPTINSATSATNLFVIASGVGTGGGVVPIADTGYQQIRFVTGGVVAGGVIFKVVCSK